MTSVILSTVSNRFVGRSAYKRVDSSRTWPVWFVPHRTTNLSNRIVDRSAYKRVDSSRTWPVWFVLHWTTNLSNRPVGRSGYKRVDISRTWPVWMVPQTPPCPIVGHSAYEWIAARDSLICSTLNTTLQSNWSLYVHASGKQHFAIL